jgi:hypothetical protein
MERMASSSGPTAHTRFGGGDLALRVFDIVGVQVWPVTEGSGDVGFAAGSSNEKIQ